MSKLFSHPRRVVTCNAAQVVAASIDDAPDYYAGEFESLRAMVRKQTEIICYMVDQMPEEQQAQLVNAVAYGWEEVS